MYACTFGALGVRVTLADARMDLLPIIDGEIRDRLEDAMIYLGITFLRPRRWGAVRDIDGAAEVHLDDASTLHADQVLFAAGRVGRTKNLGLESIDLDANHRGHLRVDEDDRTAAPSVFAVGDVFGFPSLASASTEQGRIAACWAFGVDLKRPLSMTPYGIDTIPEVSTVGDTEERYRERNRQVVVGRAPFARNARGQIQGDLAGKTKRIACSESSKVLGVHVIGERASELVHLGQAAVHMGATVDFFVDMVFNDPTLSETYHQAAYQCIARFEIPGGSMRPSKLPDS